MVSIDVNILSPFSTSYPKTKMISKQLNNLNYPLERWKSHFQEPKFPTCGDRLPETPYVKPGSVPGFFSIGNNKLCMDHRNKIKVPDPAVNDLISKK